MKIAIKGHPIRGKEVIEILESLGGQNIWRFEGNDMDYYYYTPFTDIDRARHPSGHRLYTLEEFEKEFPFKIGDKVITSLGHIGTITDIKDGKYEVFFKKDSALIAPYRLKLYKEMKTRNVTLTLEKAKEWYNKGGELREVALQAYSEEELNSKKWVDLGLPSGTLWCDSNEEGYYSWDEMKQSFNEENLPKLTDFAELYDYCVWKWDNERKGMIVIGPNYNTIFFPASGCRYYSDGGLYSVGDAGYYWSVTPHGYYAYYLYFNYDGSVYTTIDFYRAYGRAVRCIKRTR